ncbi:cytokinin riboside 5'-monophosphate phosphoribohydrolase [Siccirubricoccus deserti]|uniref:Cytokinin riboside 5'-monophosphate phosphoribohydrolase n=1 Tax=Siccirubricoccus deserti TaxID=2013562 RepID=A0A9X0UIJ1_9PROT|nr:TIGR00730 family Rossman fold protein [Siccirubricoccus deserti]MBC4017140.1 TIGR00730 family Rossman fold protein [Siccirubricoccus deserti]GGC57112.1 cytokinin riboside 5'-monophosphate phosphoribohydrolase [Siccirubricoccus deserti]
MPSAIQSVAVFCGSRSGTDPAHAEAARALGAGLATRGMTLVYGGGGIGLMGEVAKAALDAGGRVRGVIPEFLTRIERPYPALAELEITSSMHTRKTRMFELADAFVTLSGGLGTLDETVEVITWRQLGLHDKPIIILDIDGWARPLVTLFDSLIDRGFVAQGDRSIYEVVPRVTDALALLTQVEAPAGAAPAARL